MRGRASDSRISRKVPRGITSLLLLLRTDRLLDGPRGKKRKIDIPRESHCESPLPVTLRLISKDERLPKLETKNVFLPDIELAKN